MCPCERHAQPIGSHVESLSQDDRYGGDGTPEFAVANAAGCLGSAVCCVVSLEPAKRDDVREYAQGAIRCACEAAALAGDHRRVTPIREAIQAQLVPWLLGARDPLRG